MHDIKFIRKKLKLFQEKIYQRNNKTDLNNLLNLDKENRDLNIQKEKLEQEKKIISQKKDKTLFEKSKKISLEIQDVVKKQFLVKDNIEKIINSLPNIALGDVPVGINEETNKEIKKVGNIKKFDFKVLSHDALAAKNNHLVIHLKFNFRNAKYIPNALNIVVLCQDVNGSMTL